MAGIFGHRWVSSYGDNPRSVGGREWALTLANFDRDMIDAGLAVCRSEGDDWPPSASRFKAMCLGIPSLAKVRREWDEWRASPFTRLVHEHLDGWLYRQSPADKADRLLREAYEAAREHVMAGGALPDEPVALIEADKPKPITPASRETVAKHVEVIDELFGKATAPRAQEEGQA